MPVEIRELSIKVTVDDSSGSSVQNSGAGTGGNSGSQPDETLVAAIVEKVLEILKSRTER